MKPTDSAYSGPPSSIRIEEPAQSVRKPPGSTIVTLTPKGLSSEPSTSEKPSTPNFAAWYGAMPGVPPTRPPIDENCR
jgi:hypothetical protein